jgi:D-glycero-alpha-D-manno-heptose-7-phosphate kinase
MGEGVLVRARAPLRLGLAGGGTDVSPFCDIHGGCVLNATIDRHAYAVLKTIDEPRLRLIASDQGTAEELPLAARLDLNAGLRLHKAVYNEIVASFNHGKPIPLEMTTFCDAPVGSGLGSSSTLVVVMLKAFAELLNLPLDDYTTARLAFKIERVDCKLQGGRQDQYAATFGGFNFMEFAADERAIVNPLRIKNWIICELEASLILFDTGMSRESANIIADQSSSVASGEVNSIEAMHALKREAVGMKECILKGDFAGVIETMRSGWENKKRLANAVSNQHINKIYQEACMAGALAGKISGAGGGGFMMFFAPPERRLSVIRSLQRFPGEVSNCHFTETGSEAWRR